ncbi:hypothetical protein Tco_0625027 [Tanacetum coccineum]|uniref:Uncharacterized protein n=1 Tax=Tanacetum coccineum TaxID=301880 RepID=A0ABQ4WFP3_9ASTR
MEYNVDSNYNPYLDISRIFNNHEGTNNDDTIQDEKEPKEDDGDDMSDFDDYLVHNDAPFIINEDGERYKERRCKLLGIPYIKLPTCKSEKFEELTE